MASPCSPSAGAGPGGTLNRDNHQPEFSYQNAAQHLSWCSGSILVLSLFAIFTECWTSSSVSCHGNYSLEMLFLCSTDFTFIEAKVFFYIKCKPCTPLVPCLLLLSVSQLPILCSIHVVYSLTRFLPGILSCIRR